MAVVRSYFDRLFFIYCDWHKQHSDNELEHLAAVLKDGQTAGQFKSGFRKQVVSLAPYTKPEVVTAQTTGLRTVASLKPKYHCLTCSESCLHTERKSHTKQTGHLFCMFTFAFPIVHIKPALRLFQIWSPGTASFSVRHVGILSTIMA